MVIKRRPCLGRNLCKGVDKEAIYQPLLSFHRETCKAITANKGLKVSNLTE